MERKEFFNKLHLQLEVKYSIPPHCVATIRSFSLHSNMSREDIMDWADAKNKRQRDNHWQPIQRCTNLFNFLENLSDEAWEDITQITKYDSNDSAIAQLER